MQKYYVLTKFVNPVTKNSVTNRTSEPYVPFIYAEKDDGFKPSDVQEQDKASNVKYDMLFHYDGTVDLAEMSESSTTMVDLFKRETGGDNSEQITPHLVVDKFKRIKGDGWFISSIKTSLKAALSSAKPIIKAVGTKNVKIVKEAPTVMSINLDI